MIKVKLLEYTPNPEHVVAMAARLCYSSAGAEELAEKISDEKAKEMVRKMVTLGHGSTIEHVTFTFGIEGVGIYLLMPMLSPWAERVGKRELQFYLLLCFATTLIPFVRALAADGAAPVIYGPTGIPNRALYPLWGEASWNTYGLFYYLSGFIGYLLLGLYLRRFVGNLSWGKTLAVALPAWLVGFAICFSGFIVMVMNDAAGQFPIEGPTGLAAAWETTWINDTAGVFLMTIGWILVFRKINAGGWFYRNVLLPISKASYGMYLCHMIALAFFSGWLRESLGTGVDGQLGIWTTPVQILLTALLTFATVALFCVAVQRIPKLGKWVVG